MSFPEKQAREAWALTEEEEEEEEGNEEEKEPAIVERVWESTLIVLARKSETAYDFLLFTRTVLNQVLLTWERERKYLF